MEFRVYPILLGTIAGKLANSLHNCMDERCIQTAYTCFFLEGNGHTIMVDTGLPSQQDIVRNKKPFRIMPGAPSLEDAMAARHMNPQSVTDIIFTHLHYDHCSNLELFPNAQNIYVQRRELLEAVAPIESQGIFYSAREECGMPAWVKGIGRLRVLDGDEQIMDGMRVLLTPGHSPGSQSVLVNTTEGKILLTGDFIPIQESFDLRLPNRILNSQSDWYNSYDKIAALQAKLLPGHELRVHDRAVYG